MATFQEFKKLEFVTAHVVSAEEHPNADKLYVVTVDLGGEKRQVVAGIREFYSKEELVGKTVIVAKNLDPAVIRGVESQGMILAIRDEATMALLTPDRSIAAGKLVT